MAIIPQPSTFVPDPPHTCDDCAAWNKPREPFTVYGNTFYVGTDKLNRRAELKGQGTDPFIDRNGCRAYAADGLKRLEARILEENK